MAIAPKRRISAKGVRRSKPRKNAEKEYHDPAWPKGLYRRPSGFFRWRRMIDGEREFARIRTKNLNYAIKRAIELNEDVEDKQVPIRAAVSKESATFQQAADQFLASRMVKPNTLKRYRAILGHFNRIIPAITGKPTVLLTDVTEEVLGQYVNRRSKDEGVRDGHPNSRKTIIGAKPKTIQTEVELFQAILKFAVRKRWLSMSPASIKVPGLKRKELSTVARPLTEDEIPRLLKAAKVYDKMMAGRFPYRTYFHDIIATYIYTGLRHQELQFLEWVDVDLDKRLIQVREKRTPCRRVLPIVPTAWQLIEPMLAGKSSADPAFPDDEPLLERIGQVLQFKETEPLRHAKVGGFDPESMTLTFEYPIRWSPKSADGAVVIHRTRLLRILQKLAGQHDSNWVFPHSDGGYWRMHFRRHLIKIAEIAEIPNLSRVHDLRHTTGAVLRRSGAHLETIQGILRHQSIQDTLIYARYHYEEGLKAIDKLPSW